MEHIIALFSTSEAWISLLTLTFLEIVLGIDNIIFISIVSNKLPEKQQPKARRIGLLLAMGVRCLLLLSITWLLKFTEPLFSIMEHPFSGKDLILMAGGLFLLGKSTTEIFHKMEGHANDEPNAKGSDIFVSIIIQIVLIDIVFSFDSILTAVGLSKEIFIMMMAVIISIFMMMLYSNPIAKFVNNNPSIQMLALAFLIMIGVMLVAESFGEHVPKGYIYFGMLFSLLVEVLNMRMRKKNDPLQVFNKKDIEDIGTNEE